MALLKDGGIDMTEEGTRWRGIEDGRLWTSLDRLS